MSLTSLLTAVQAALVGIRSLAVTIWSDRVYLVGTSGLLVELAGWLQIVPSTQAQAAAVGLLLAAGVLMKIGHANSLADVLAALDSLKTDDRTVPRPSGLDLTPLVPAQNSSPEIKDPDILKFPGLMLLACLVIGSTAAAAVPKAVITGPEQAILGEIIELSAASSDGEPLHFSWEITPEIRGRRQLKVSPSGESTIVASYGGDYLVTLTVSNADGHSTAHHPLHIPGTAPPQPSPQPVPPGPVPTPGPNPSPGPAPAPPAPTPPGPTPGPAPAPEIPLTGLSLSVYNAAMQVSSPNRASEAVCLANGCAGISSSIAAGKYDKDTAGQALSSLALASSLVTEMGAAMDRCSGPPWTEAREAIATKVGSMWKAGQLKTAADWKMTLDQVEAGLRRVK